MEENKETQIEKFDPNTIMNGVKDKIKATFVDMIPEDQWSNLIKKEIDDFFLDTKGKFDSVKPSQFKLLVRGEIETFVKERVGECIRNDPRYMEQWSATGGPSLVSEELMNQLIRRAPEIIASCLQSLMQETINIMKNQTYTNNY